MNQLNPEKKERYIQINVDVQNDFCPGGALAVTDGDQVVESLNNLARTVRGTKDGLVVFTQDFHPPHTDHFNTWPVHCVQGTQGVLLHQDLEYVLGDETIKKGMSTVDDGYSAFEGIDTDTNTSLEEIITVDKNRTIVLMIGGLATDFCVRATALDAINLANRQKEIGQKISVILIKDAIKAVNLVPDAGDKAIAEMEKAGVQFATSRELIEKITQQVARL